MKTIKVRIEGMTPLLLHNPRLANPLDPESKKHKERSDTSRELGYLIKKETNVSFFMSKVA